MPHARTVDAPTNAVTKTNMPHADANGRPTPQMKALQEYAFASDLQDLMQKLLADVFSEQPREPLGYMIEWLSQERERRADEGKQ